MVFQQLSDLYQKIGSNNRYGVEDAFDRLNLCTVILFALAALLVGVKQYVMNEISCYIPVSPSGDKFKEFVNDYCWVRGTIPFFPGEKVPDSTDGWKEYADRRRITYYQWVPFLLGLQCILFYLPHLLWQMTCIRLAGGDLFSLMKAAAEAAVYERDLRRNQIKRIIEFIQDIVAQEPKTLKENFFIRLCRAWRSARLQYCYLVYKVTLITNAVIQLYMIQVFLGFYEEGNYGRESLELRGGGTLNGNIDSPGTELSSFPGINFGLVLAHHLRTGQDWRRTMLFPRVALCFVDSIEAVGHKHSYTAQCALPVNMLNEKLYIFFWFWIVGLIIASTISLFIWLFVTLLPDTGIRHIGRYLRVKRLVGPDTSKAKLRRFTQGYLMLDGLFIIRMLTSNAGEIVTAEIVESLYKSDWNDNTESEEKGESESLLPNSKDQPPAYV